MRILQPFIRSVVICLITPAEAVAFRRDRVVRPKTMVYCALKRLSKPVCVIALTYESRTNDADKRVEFRVVTRQEYEYMQANPVGHISQRLFGGTFQIEKVSVHCHSKLSTSHVYDNDLVGHWLEPYVYCARTAQEFEIALGGINAQLRVGNMCKHSAKRGVTPFTAAPLPINDSVVNDPDIPYAIYWRKINRNVWIRECSCAACIPQILTRLFWISSNMRVFLGGTKDESLPARVKKLQKINTEPAWSERKMHINNNIEQSAFDFVQAITASGGNFTIGMFGSFTSCTEDCKDATSRLLVYCQSGDPANWSGLYLCREHYKTLPRTALNWRVYKNDKLYMGDRTVAYWPI